MKRIYGQIIFAIFLLSNNSYLYGMQQDDSDKPEQPFTVTLFYYGLNTGILAGCLYAFGNFFYGAYQESVRTLERRVDNNTRILGTFLAANVSDEHKVRRIKQLLRNEEYRDYFLEKSDSSDQKKLEKLFPAIK